MTASQVRAAPKGLRAKTGATAETEEMAATAKTPLSTSKNSASQSFLMSSQESRFLVTGATENEARRATEENKAPEEKRASAESAAPWASEGRKARLAEMLSQWVRPERRLSARERK